MTIQRGVTQATQSQTLGDLLERILDKGIVIAGDIRIKLVEVELLTIQLRLVVCSVDKAREMGMDWWVNNPMFSRQAAPEPNGDHLGALEKRLTALEVAATSAPAPAPAPAPARDEPRAVPTRTSAVPRRAKAKRRR